MIRDTCERLKSYLLYSTVNIISSKYVQLHVSGREKHLLARDFSIDFDIIHQLQLSVRSVGVWCMVYLRYQLYGVSAGKLR